MRQSSHVPIDGFTYRVHLPGTLHLLRPTPPPGKQGCRRGPGHRSAGVRDGWYWPWKTLVIHALTEERRWQLLPPSPTGESGRTVQVFHTSKLWKPLLGRISNGDPIKMAETYDSPILLCTGPAAAEASHRPGRANEGDPAAPSTPFTRYEPRGVLSDFPELRRQPVRGSKGLCRAWSRATGRSRH